jgi:hypothetical protein
MHAPAARGAPQPRQLRPIVSCAPLHTSAQRPASVRQPVSPAQLPRQHSLPAPGVHSVGAAPRQVPVPSHASPVVQLSVSSQLTVVPWSAHAPAPSHVPVVPQVLGASSAHSASGSMPLPWSVHVPSEPRASHARHTPSHAVSQQ